MTDETDLEQNVEEVERLLDAETPPLAPLGTTTDYRQILLAWARRHGLTLDEALERLGADPDPVGAAWVEKINAHPESRAAMAASLVDPVFAADSSEDPRSVDDLPAEEARTGD
jgi:hypothetical protein